jgi:hypothetical protein
VPVPGKVEEMLGEDQYLLHSSDPSRCHLTPFQNIDRQFQQDVSR